MTYQLSFKPVLKLVLFILLSFMIYNLVKTPHTYHITTQTKDKSMDGLRDSVWTPTY